ncbi:MAG: AsmA family protein [Magnetospirillum sp.]|nr:AsmA family protein [Magnetospirillum sp.]
MRLSSLLKTAAIAALAMAVALIAVVKSIDVERYKGFLTAKVRSVTGRDMAITGPLRLELGLSPKVVASGVTLANAPWGSRRNMLTIQRVEAQLALLPLLSRDVVIESLTLVAPDLLIETDAHGRGNWLLNTAKPVERVPANGAPPTQFAINAVSIRDARVSWHDGRGRGTASFVISRMALQPSGPGGKLGVQMTGDFEGKAFTASGVVGPLGALKGGKPWDVNLKASMAGTLVTVDGIAAPPSSGTALDLTVKAQGDELAQAATLAGVPFGTAHDGTWPAVGPFRLSTHLTAPGGRLRLDGLDLAAGNRDTAMLSARGAIGDVKAMRDVDLAVSIASDNMAGLSRLTGSAIPPIGPLEVGARLTDTRTGWHLADIRGTLADSDFSGDLTLTQLPRPVLRGTLISTSLTLADFVTPAAKPGERQASPRTVAPGGDGRLFSASPLPFGALTAMDGDLSLKAQNVKAGRVALSDLAGHVRLDGGRLSFDPVTARLAGGTLTGALGLDASSGKTAVLAIHLDGENLDLGKILRDTGGTDVLNGGPTRVHLDLHSQGPSVRALMAGLGGEAVTTVGTGSIRNDAVDWAGADMLLQFLASVDPTSKPDDTTAMQCAVVRFVVHDGVATADKGIAVETDRVNVVGAGTVDLRNEALDLGISPVARDGGSLGFGGAIAGVTRIRGTLADPRIGFDGMGAARTAAAFGAAVTTGGLPPLGEAIYDGTPSTAHPCQVALGKAPPRKPAKAHKSRARAIEAPRQR